MIQSSHAGTVRLAVHLVGWRTHVKFYRRSFSDVVEDEEGRFEGFSHVADWVPQRLVTATGPNPLPR